MDRAGIAVSRLASCVFLYMAFIFFPACNDLNSAEVMKQQQVNAAVSCTRMGLTPTDSLLYTRGGGLEFDSTHPNPGHPASIPEGMVWVPGGEFSMGGINPAGMQDGGMENMQDARPVHRVFVDGFYMDATEVTNAQFADFVEATGYITIAEQKPDKREFPDAPEENLVAGSVVFSPPAADVSLNDRYQWWNYIKGANWRHPEGPGSTIEGKDNYPVVQVAWEDANAYAKWAGKRLPTEAEWEFASRGGRPGALYVWGNQFRPDGKWMANTYQGKFPVQDIATDGYKGVAPVKQFPANDYGLYDLAGNVWEWCNDWYRPDYYQELKDKGIVSNPRGPAASYDPGEPGQRKKVQRGGSFLCTDQYCTRYMSGTRGKGEWRSGANHLGFRCIKDIPHSIAMIK